MLIDIKMQIAWLEHSEYDESAVHELYRPVLSSGRGFGAQRWVATLQRFCECAAILASPTISREDQTGLRLLPYPFFSYLFSLINMVYASV